MQDKNKNANVIFPGSDGAQSPSSFGVLQGSSNMQALSNDPVPLDPIPPNPNLTKEISKQPNVLVRLARRADVILAILLILGSLGLVVGTRNSSQDTDVDISKQFEITQIPLVELVSAEGVTFGAQKVTINGTLVLSPSSQPTIATAGQIYYDQSGNVLSYYNGTEFILLSGSQSSTNVFSLQGQTGSVTLTAGNGIGIAGTTISNTGVVSLVSGNSSLVVADDGAGNHVLTVSPSSATLQAVYDAGNTIDTTNNRSIVFNLTEQTTDPNFLVDLQCDTACGTNGRFALQDDGTDVFSISPAGGAALFRNTSNSTSALQVQSAVGATVFGVDTTNHRVGINTASPSALLQINQNNLTPGTVSNSAGSANVTGTSTTFLSTFQPGDSFIVTSSGNSCTIQQITSDTALVCRATLASVSSGSAYSFTQQSRLTTANNGTTSIPGTLILSNPSTNNQFSFRNDEAANTLIIGANIIGNASDDGGSDTNTDYIQASVFNSGTGGTIDSMRVCFTIVDGASPNFKVAVYSDSAGSPNALLSSATVTASAGAAGWSTASLGTTVTLAPNTNYWLAFSMQVGVTTRYCRQDGGTTKYQSGFTWGTNFPATYTVTDTTSTTVAAYAPYISITDHSAVGGAIKITENNEVAIRPLYNSDTTFEVLRKDGATAFSVNTFDRYAFASQMMIGAADTNYTLFAIGNHTNGVLGARRTTSTATDSIVELFSDVGGSGTLQLKVQADGTLRIGNPTADATGALLVLDTKNTSADPSVVNGGLYYNSATSTSRCAQGGIWLSCVGGLATVNTSIPAGNTIANTTSETNFASNWSMPANYCVQGRVIRWTAQGTHSTTGTPTLTLRLKAGSTTLAASPALTTGSGVTDRGWRIEGQTICNAAPAATAATETQGIESLFTTATTAIDAELVNTTTTNLATNGALTLQISAQWGAADPANTVTMRQFIVEAIGP